MTAPTRVLFVNAGHALGGAEHSLLLLIRGLERRGVETAVVLFGRGPLQNRLTAQGIEAIVVDPALVVRRAGRYGLTGLLAGATVTAAGLPAAFRLAAEARRVKADVIHTNGMKAHLLGGLAGRLVGVPVVWHLRDFPPTGWARHVFDQAARCLPALVLANSEAVARAIRPAGSAGVPVLKLYNPVDLERFHPGVAGDRIRRELGMTDDAPLIGMVAHLTPWKGHALFLNIARAVAETLPQVRVVVVGGSIYETDGHAGCAETLGRQAAALGLSDRVIFLGARDDVPEILAGLDALVHCPIAPEPSGRVLAEAMAVGCPVVAARCGGIPEIVEDWVTGLLVRPLDTEAFAAGVVALLRDPALRDRLGRAGRLRAEALFTVEAHAARVLDAYRTLPSRRSAVA